MFSKITKSSVNKEKSKRNPVGEPTPVVNGALWGGIGRQYVGLLILLDTGANI